MSFIQLLLTIIFECLSTNPSFLGKMYCYFLLASLSVFPLNDSIYVFNILLLLTIIFKCLSAFAPVNLTHLLLLTIIFKRLSTNRSRTVLKSCYFLPSFLSIFPLTKWRAIKYMLLLTIIFECLSTRTSAGKGKRGLLLTIIFGCLSTSLLLLIYVSGYFLLSSLSVFPLKRIL